nr:hypothetical protein [Tanacetum cinerariifolium]
MVLGLRSKHRKDGSVQVNYLIHVQDLKPWLPTSQSLSLQWVNGDQMTDFLSPNVIDSTVDFNKSFTLPLTLRKDKKDRDKFQKNYLEFHLWEPRKDKPNKDQVLGSAIVNLGDYGIIENVLNLSLPIIWKKSSKSVAQPVLYISIQSNDRDETNSSRSSLSTQSSLDKYGQESASEDDDNDDYTHSSYPNQKKNYLEFHLWEPRKDKPNKDQVLGSAIVNLGDYGIIENVLNLSLPIIWKKSSKSVAQPVLYISIQSNDRDETNSSRSSLSTQSSLDKYGQESASEDDDNDDYTHSSYPNQKDSLNAQPPVVPIKAEPSNNTSSKHTERSMTTVRKQNAAPFLQSCFSTMGSHNKTIGSKIQMTISQPLNVTHGLQEEIKPNPIAVITSSVSKDPIKVESLHDQVTTFENEQDERTSEDKKISEDNLGVQLPKAGGYTGNGFPIASPNRADKDKVIGTNNESSDTAVSRCEISNGKSEDRSRIEMLEEELRETAAIEAGLYSIVAEHGSSTNKVHAPARRLSRFFLHACKEKDQEKRVNAARAIVSGLVLVSKSCGNDVPRLTFWLSNSVMLRAIIYQTLGESVDVLANHRARVVADSYSTYAINSH